MPRRRYAGPQLHYGIISSSLSGLWRRGTGGEAQPAKCHGPINLACDSLHLLDTARRAFGSLGLSRTRAARARAAPHQSTGSVDPPAGSCRGTGQRARPRQPKQSRTRTTEENTWAVSWVSASNPTKRPAMCAEISRLWEGGVEGHSKLLIDPFAALTWG